MGTVDPAPQQKNTGRPGPRPVASSKAPPQEFGITGIGAISIFFGVGLFILAFLIGGAIPLIIIGLAFIGGGVLTRRKRLCPACRMSVPAEATVCGHCRTEL
jgi:hypothetical protein